MSLLKRVESAKRGPGDPNDRAVVPVAPAQPAQTRGPGRGEQIGDIRLRLQSEVIAAFSDLIDAKPEEVTTKMEGIVDRVITEGDLAVTGSERQKLVDFITAKHLDGRLSYLFLCLEKDTGGREEVIDVGVDFMECHT